MSTNNHNSWKLKNSKSKKEIFNNLKEYQSNINIDNLNLQNSFIPEVDINNFNIFNEKNQEKLYNIFFNQTGVLVIKNVYKNKIMDEFNKWSENILKEANKDKNCIHPKQIGKFLINDVIGRMSENNPKLLLELINNKYFTTLIDILLGFGKIGSCTGHWIEPGGDRQHSHVDYPIHIGSGPFWENSVNKLKNLTTNYQINSILPYYSLQVLIASDKMNKSNGSTEVVPCSHLLEDMDLIIHNKEIYNEFEKYFINVELEQGDMLIFNRRLCHRGGKNISNKRRNSLIVQCIWLWGIGQEIIESSKILSKLNKYLQKMDSDTKEKFLLRLNFPYPCNVKNST